jgi:hypothetical protein
MRSPYVSSFYWSPTPSRQTLALSQQRRREAASTEALGRLSGPFSGRGALPAHFGSSPHCTRCGGTKPASHKMSMRVCGLGRLERGGCRPMGARLWRTLGIERRNRAGEKSVVFCFQHNRPLSGTTKLRLAAGPHPSTEVHHYARTEEKGALLDSRLFESSRLPTALFTMVSRDLSILCPLQSSATR